MARSGRPLARFKRRRISSLFAFSEGLCFDAGKNGEVDAVTVRRRAWLEYLLTADMPRELAGRSVIFHC